MTHRDTSKLACTTPPKSLLLPAYGFAARMDLLAKCLVLYRAPKGKDTVTDWVS